jgi:pyruvate ferredoxin oxidoreductase gamma subunit
MVEIRWHGRGGQGAKTASLLLADAAFNTGKFIQGFPEYGPERMGAPMTAYNRIDESEIRIHSNVYEPDYVVVVDDTLIGPVDVTNGLKKEGAILINTSEPLAKIKEKLKGYSGKIYVLDATKISLECLKANFPNTALLAAIIKITNIMDRDTLIKDMEGSFKHKFARKPEVIPANMECLTRGFDELIGGTANE